MTAENATDDPRSDIFTVRTWIILDDVFPTWIFFFFFYVRKQIKKNQEEAKLKEIRKKKENNKHLPAPSRKPINFIHIISA